MSRDRTPALLPSFVFAALAGAMGWGIRGQYGHETGAMIAGVLVGLVLVLVFGRSATSLSAARAAALFTLGISVGGSMTYGQTVGLTHDVELVGNWPALGWGLLGLFIKGGIWIGLASALLGTGLSGKSYRSIDISLLLITMCFLWFLGVYLINSPFDPANHQLPRIYFSDSWRWEPDATLNPRREVWGGLLLALLGLVAYARIAKQDRLVLRLACWGFLAGGLGFSLGQCVQAGHAWNAEWFRTAEQVKQYAPLINWWNMMETTFGAIFAAVLALGLWLNADLIELPVAGSTTPASESELGPVVEWLLLGIHVATVAVWNFLSFSRYDLFADQALTMILIPVLAVTAGRLWPYFVMLPVALFPIAGKTVRELVYQGETVSPWIGWGAYFVLPVTISLLVAWILASRQQQQSGGRFAVLALLVSTWTFFALNLAFFRYPWPWEPWTSRTPNGLIFFGCALGLTLAAAVYSWPPRDADDEDSEHDDDE